jgi:hypothetical protein
MEQAARELAHEPRLKQFSAAQLKALVEFVAGNTLFVTTHELGHAAISELDLPVLGREEDAADAFAILTALKVSTAFSHEVLVEAARGWFLSARRDRAEGDMPAYYGQHGLNEQRAYFIICLMVGSDPVKFKDLADEYKLPEERRRTCAWDYETVSRSWDRVLAPHRRAPDQPKSRIDVRYEDAPGRLGLFARIFRDTRFLDLVAEHAAERYVWPAPFLIEMRSCGAPGARWTVPTRTLHVCYEIAQEFGELYRGYGSIRKTAKRSRTH